jgi:predicted AlkP superfamily phosphohydrolase/phosphomutase
MDAVSPKLVERFASEGALPDMSRLMQRGAFAPAVPCIPAYTPTNWATLCTGSWPGTHGAVGWTEHSMPEILGRQPLSTFDSRAITAETIWEAAERAGLVSLCIAYPGAAPRRTSRHLVVAPLDRGLVSLDVMSGQLYSTEQEPGARLLELRPASGRCAQLEPSAQHAALVLVEGEARQPTAAEVGAVEDGAEVRSAAAVHTGRVAFDLLFLPGSPPQALVFPEGSTSADQAEAQMHPGEWSRWLVREFQTPNGAVPCSFRFKLQGLSPDARKARLVRSAVYPARGFTEPPELSGELFESVGPYFEHSAHGGPSAWREWVLEEMNYQVDWHIKTARHLLETRGWDIFYNHWHFPDSVQHQFLSIADPSSPNYDRERAEDALDMLRQAYVIGDRLVGGMLELAGEKTIFTVVSDHGHVSNRFTCNLPRRLGECGLMEWKDEPGSLTQGDAKLDWPRTRVYILCGLNINVNLKGREPMGMVAPEDYEKTQEDIIECLLSWKEPKSGERVVAIALKKRDAQVLGMWGPRCGDVVFVYNAGFSWGHVEPGRTVGVAPPSANHGPQVPTAETPLSNNLAALIISGPGVKRGWRPSPDAGLPRLVDVVPTICHLIGIPPPRTSEGRVVWELIEGA